MSVRSLNKVQLIGNLTRDPELRYTPSGTAVCTFGVATNRSWTNDSGERQEDAEFHRIVAWAKLGEICAQLLYKGRKVFVEGRLQTRKWTGQDNVERESTEIVIDQMIALGAPKGRSGGDDDDYVSYDDEFSGYEDDEGEEEMDEPEEKKAPKKKAASKSKSSKEKKEEPEEDELDVDDIPF